MGIGVAQRVSSATGILISSLRSAMMLLLLLCVCRACYSVCVCVGVRICELNNAKRKPKVS